MRVPRQSTGFPDVERHWRRRPQGSTETNRPLPFPGGSQLDALQLRDLLINKREDLVS